MQLDIITPEKILFSADAHMVVIPGTEGHFGVLAGHAPLISTIRPGVITIDMENGSQRRVAILGGIAEVIPERCTVLAETAEEFTSLTAADIQARFEAAKAESANAVTDSERQLAAKKLALAEARLMAA